MSSDFPPPENPREPVLDSRALNVPGAPAAAAFAASRALDSTTPVPPPAALPPAGHVLGGYEILEQVGAGGFSIVMRARQVATGNIVALKLPRVPEFIAHLKREALMSAKIQDPQVVPILEVRLDLDPPFLVMPYIDGANLNLPEAAPAPEWIATELRRFRRIVEVVARLHAAGIAHGDLKPGNIRFSNDLVCHVLDLGVARQQVKTRQLSTLRASIVSVTGEKIAGTLEFMAPEVMSGAPPAAAADVYALGVILHHLLCGKPPAFGVAPDTLNPFLPPRCTDFLRQLLHLDPARRPASAAALLPAIDHFIAAEDRCLRRRNGHARRRVFTARMRTLSRGLRVLAPALAFVLVTVFLGRVIAASPAGPSRRQPDFGAVDALLIVGSPLLGLLVAVCTLLAMTTLNAWVMGVPEKLYKNRSGHPWWSFMMQ